MEILQLNNKKLDIINWCFDKKKNIVDIFGLYFWHIYIYFILK